MPLKPYCELTPAAWSHPSQLAMVRDWFYPEKVSRPAFDFSGSSQVDRRQDAVNTVALWQFRDPKLAPALLSTSQLTDAILHDQPGRQERISGPALRSIYAMAFCRFVNALVDRDVRKSKIASIAKGKLTNGSNSGSGSDRGQSSMYAHAAALGLPETFVELRHQAIHEEMPSLEMLRMRTGEALEWLWERWWKFNVKGGPEPGLSEWEEKHELWRRHQRQNEAADTSELCRRCRKRKRSDREEDEDDAPGSGEEADKNPNKHKGLKHRKVDTGQNGQDPSSPNQNGWTIHFYGGIS